MFKDLFSKHLPLNLRLASTTSKIALGIFLITFFLGYQPTLGFPPLRKSSAHAQESEQTQTINPKEIPVVFQLPHDGYVSTHFSFFHPGIDLATALGTVVHPVAPGKVISEGYDFWGLGENVVVDHGHGYQSLYAHLGQISVKEGQEVSSSDTLGTVGLTGHTTGPHTHLQISKDGVNFDPLTVLPSVRNFPTEADFNQQSRPQS